MRTIITMLKLAKVGMKQVLDDLVSGPNCLCSVGKSIMQVFILFEGFYLINLSYVHMLYSKSLFFLTLVLFRIMNLDIINFMAIIYNVWKYWYFVLKMIYARSLILPMTVVGGKYARNTSVSFTNMRGGKHLCVSCA